MMRLCSLQPFRPPANATELVLVDRLSAQATVIEILEDAGVPSLCLASASSENAHRKVGEVLAEAVQVSCVSSREASWLSC